ncbi:GNAT family N-acetyltransferase [Streptomyces sp. NPDC059788]|uniref:GNAT family N-acetyltransferase n=1 Tax=Streptomyces sp. NPDC059788 TaxID=3346948 RepID=UPI00364D21E3
MFVFSGDPVRTGRIDPEFAEEAGAARAAGARCAVLGRAALLAGDVPGAVAGVPYGAGAAWYRGRALPPERYGTLAAALGERGCPLLTTPDSYRAARDSAGPYETFAGLAPDSRRPARTPGQPPGTARARVWWVDGEPVLVGAHPDTPGRCPRPDLSAVAPVVRAALRRLGCRFVTTDLALRPAGGWRVTGVDDGQVGELPGGADSGTLIETLATVGAGFPVALAAGRVVLRPVLPTAAARLADQSALPGGTVWAGGEPPEPTVSCAEALVRAAAAGLYRPGWGLFTIVRADDGTAVGSICLHGPPDEDGTVEIGYALCPAARGAGWATEATRLLADWAAGRPEVRTVLALTEAANEPSRRVLERAGFVPSDDRYGLRAHIFAGTGRFP